MRIRDVRSTDLFTGPAHAPRQVVRVTVQAGPGAGTGPSRLRVEGPTVSTPAPVPVPALAAGEERVVEAGVVIAAPAPEGSVHRVTAVWEETTGPGSGGGSGTGAGRAGGSGQAVGSGSVVASATGWTMWMISHFHYDPVWWNTQAGFTEIRHQLPDLPWVDRLRPPHVRSAFDLVRAHLDAARHDEDYRFVLAEIDYLKPHWDAFPRDRADLRRFLRDDRIELVGGSYNEPNTNLTHPESTIRNTVMGVGYQRDILGGDPRSGWQLDVFGHDPAYPGLLADAGLDSSAWARGPFHNSGPVGHTGDIERMEFPSEFEWISPSGRGVLTHYMAGHYTAGWAIHRTESLDAAMAAAYDQFASLKKVAATRNVLLPVGHDHNVPSRWCTEIHRAWSEKYVWPRFTMGLPRDFFAAVRRESAGGTGSPARRISPQTRDMNPVFTGKDVSYIDTKQAQRAAETAVLDGERLATLAALLGESFPAADLDKAWRQLAYGAHHDAITGTESDQVYLDLVGGWREAYELGDRVRTTALRALACHTDTRGEGQAVLVANTLSWQRDGLVTLPLDTLPHDTLPVEGLTGSRPVVVRDTDGKTVPSVTVPSATGAGTVTFLARDVPSLGHRVYHLAPLAEGEQPTDQVQEETHDQPAAWTPVPGATAAANDRFRIEADPARGGVLTRITDLRDGRELLRPNGVGAELTLQDEHTTHPVWGEGPWHLLPKGPASHRTGDRPAASVRVERSPLGERLVTETPLDGLRLTQTATLLHGSERVDFHTRVDGSIGEDRLLRVRFDLDLPGTLPVSEVGFAAIGRPFGFPDSDAAEHMWTLDNPAHTWSGLSTTARVALHGADGTTLHHAFGIAEVIAPADLHVRPLLTRLVARGVTATSTRPDSPRYGSLDADSNLPDIRVTPTTDNPADNPFAEAVLASCAPEFRQALAAHGRVFVPAERSRHASWRPGADLRGVRDLPVLIVRAGDTLADLVDGAVDVPVPAGLPTTAEPACDYSAALLNHGTPSSVATPDGSLHLTLMRACTDWPAGVWLDGERRTAPDGSGFNLQHWSHDFRFSLTAGPGDWRQAGFVRAGHEANHPLLATATAPSPGQLPPRVSLVEVAPATVGLSALKPRGNPLSSGLPGDTAPARDGLTVRLYETQGRPVTAELRVYGGLAAPERTDLLEHSTAPAPTALECGTDGAVRIPLGAADIATIAAVPLHRPDGRQQQQQAGHEEQRPSPAHEPVQPVFARYWLHNTGPAPIGGLPTNIRLTRLETTGTAGTAETPDTAAFRITVSVSARPARGTVTLDLPPGLSALPLPPLDYDLAPGEYAEFEIRVRRDSAAAPGTYFVAARLRDEEGQLLEDALPFTPEDPAAPLDLGARLTRPGPGRLTLLLANPTAGEVRGEAHLISPYGTWGAPGDPLTLAPRLRGFALAPGATTALDFTVTTAPDPGPAGASGEWWALAKVASFGRVLYTNTVALNAEVPPSQ
ncbi:glycoside hydrolase family 38 N-terminal domain-containing protein [Streptomyces paludis]|uniref:Glycoside hydrolase n=1 Tax=Streptomyces paludis TaxID=2282738 RepID=A0A345HTD0_9ACTN|nr:glycoside hydrolase family 38 C-terminal domain-containing protein [Streptomyces paludis]AXG79954.1 glycoside hydrolase [Streptomyces paludis]